MPTLNLPVAGGKVSPYTTKPPRHFPAAKPPFNRIAYAAAHVVADPLADGDPWLDAAIDWERTVAFRRQLWSRGLDPRIHLLRKNFCKDDGLPGQARQ